MANARAEIEKLVQQLEQQRDELRVKVALARLEAKSEWEQLEKQWQHIRSQASQMRDELDDTAGGVATALKKAAEEIRDGYVRLRKLL